MLSAEHPKKLFLLDAYALIYRAYFAFSKNPRVNSKGENTSAAFGFTNVLIDILKNERPTHIAVVFDPPGGSTVRQEDFKESKEVNNEIIKLYKESNSDIVEIPKMTIEERTNFIMNHLFNNGK